MSTLATLTIDLAANSAKFRSELAKANKSSKGFATQARSAATAASKAFVASAAATGAALAGITSSYLKSIDSLAKTSDSIGIATEALQGLRFAGELTGVSADQLDKALQKQSKSIGEAQAGYGQAKTTLEDLGLANEAFFKLKPDEQFEAIAGAINGLGTASERSAAAAAIYGRQGVALTNTLALGSEGIREQREEFRALGLEVSRFDAAKVEAANDALFKARSTFASFGQTLAVEFAPLITGISQAFTDSVKEAGGFGKVAEGVVNFVVKGFSAVADTIHGIQVTFAGLKVVAQAVGVGLVGITAGAGKGFVELGNIIRRAVLFPVRKVLELAAPFSDTAKEALESATALANADFDTSGFDNAMQTQIAAYRDARDQFSSALLEPLPSEKIQEFVFAAREAADQAAVQVAANSASRALPQIGNDTLASGTGEDDGLTDEERQQQELDAFRQTIDSKAALLSQFSAFSKQTASDLLSFDLLTEKQKVATRKKVGRELVAGLAKDSKAAFKVQQAMSIADTVMNTYRAAQGAYSALAGIPIVGPALGIAAAAAATAFGVKQVQAIKKQKFGGGSGSITTGSPSGINATSAGNNSQPQGVPAINTDDRTNGTPQQINLTVTGDFISSRDFAEAVNGSLGELYKDGAQAPITVVAA